MAKGRFLALTGTAFLLASALNMQSAAAGSCYKHDEDFKKQLMNKATSLFFRIKSFSSDDNKPRNFIDFLSLLDILFKILSISSLYVFLKNKLFSSL